MEPKLPNIFCLQDLCLISESEHDSVRATDLSPAIKTEHAAIKVEFCNCNTDFKGPGYWKMNRSLLEDGDYIKDITEKIPMRLAEGRDALSDNRNIWD